MSLNQLFLERERTNKKWSRKFFPEAFSWSWILLLLTDEIQHFFFLSNHSDILMKKMVRKKLICFFFSFSYDFTINITFEKKSLKMLKLWLYYFFSEIFFWSRKNWNVFKFSSLCVAQNINWNMIMSWFIQTRATFFTLYYAKFPTLFAAAAELLLLYFSISFVTLPLHISSFFFFFFIHFISWMLGLPQHLLLKLSTSCSSTWNLLFLRKV